jgi:hypothetical protein
VADGRPEGATVPGPRPEGAPMPIFGIFLKKTKSLPRVLSRLLVNPSASVRFPTLGECGFPVERFPDSLPRELHRGRLPRVQRVLPRVHLAPGEDRVSRSVLVQICILDHTFTPSRLDLLVMTA